MAAMRIEVQMPRRRAVARISKYAANKIGFPDAGDYECLVLFGSTEADEDGSVPVFVCEFLNGNVYNVPTESVSFIDTDDKGVIL